MDNKKLQEMKKKVENTVDPKHKGFFHTRLFKVFATFFAIVIALILYNCVVRDTPSTPEEEAEQQAKEQYLDTFDVVGDYLFKTPQQTNAKNEDEEKKDEDDKQKKETAKEDKQGDPAAGIPAGEEIIESADLSSDTKPAPPAPEPKKTPEPSIEKIESPQVTPIE